METMGTEPYQKKLEEFFPGISQLEELVYNYWDANFDNLNTRKTLKGRLARLNSLQSLVLYLLIKKFLDEGTKIISLPANFDMTEEFEFSLEDILKLLPNIDLIRNIQIYLDNVYLLEKNRFLRKDTLDSDVAAQIYLLLGDIGITMKFVNLRRYETPISSEEIFNSHIIQFADYIKRWYMFSEGGIVLINKTKRRGELAITKDNIFGLIGLKFKPIRMFGVIKETETQYKIQLTKDEDVFCLNDANQLKLLILKALRQAFPEAEFLMNDTLDIIISEEEP